MEYYLHNQQSSTASFVQHQPQIQQNKEKTPHLQSSITASPMNLFITYPRFTLQSKETKCWLCHQGKMRPFPIYGNWLDIHEFHLPVLLILYLPLSLLLHLCACLGKMLCTYIQSLCLGGPWPCGSCRAEAPFTICQQVRK